MKSPRAPKRPDHTFWMATGAILLFAWLSAFFVGIAPINGSQVPFYYFNYDNGFMQRGMLGELFRLVHGEPNYISIHQFVPFWDKTLMVGVMALSSFLLLAPILRMRVSPRARYLLLAFAALCLLAPQMRYASFYTGYGDKYVFLFALLALCCLIARKPVLFSACIVTGYLFHSQMAIYALVLAGFACHAILSRPRYRARWRAWLAAAAAPFLLFTLFVSLQDVERIRNAVENSDILSYIPRDSWNWEILVQQTVDYSIYEPIFVRRLWQLYTSQTVLMTIVFGVMPFLLLMVFVYVCRRERLLADGDYPRGAPFVNRAADILRRYDVYLLFAAAWLAFFPALFVVPDMHRALSWAQWGAALTYIYCLWIVMDAPQKPAKNAKKKEDARASAKARQTMSFSALLFAMAYGFGGAGNIDVLNGGININECKRYCIPLLTTSNPLGDLYTRLARSFMMAGALPVEFSGAVLRQTTVSGLRESNLEPGDALTVPIDWQGEVFYYIIAYAKKGENIKFRLRYRADAPPPLQLNLSDDQGRRYAAQPAKIDGAAAEWTVQVPHAGAWFFSFNTQGGTPFAIERMKVEKI